MTASRGRVLCAAAILGVAATTAADETNGPHRAAITLDALVTAAINDNAELANLRASWEAGKEGPMRERALPNPILTYGAMDQADRFPGTSQQRLRVEQTFPWLGKRALKSKIAGQDAARAGYDYEARCRDVAMEVKERYYDLCATRTTHGIVEAEESVLRQLARVAQGQYAAGQVSQPDAVKAQAEIPVLEARGLDLASREDALTARLNALLNRPATAPLTVTEQAPPRTDVPSMETLLAVAMENRPEIRASQAVVDRSGFERALMRKESFPDVTAAFEYRHMSQDEDLSMLMVGIDLPIWVRKNAAGVRAATQGLLASRAALEAAQRGVEFDVRDARFKLETALRTVDLYEKELAPQAELRYKASEAGYRAGKVDFLDLLESERFLLNARIMRAEALGRAGTERARLERAIGAELPKPGGADAPPQGNDPAGVGVGR